MQRRAIPLALAAALACSCSKDRTVYATAGPSAASRASAPSAAPIVAAPDSEVDANGVRRFAGPRPDESQWFPEADSVLRRTLAIWFDSTRAPANAIELRNCDEEGNDSPPAYLVVGRFRVLGHDSLGSGNNDDDLAPFWSSTFHVELTSAARLTLAESVAHETVPDSVRQFTEPYDVNVSPRVDTLVVTVFDYVSPPRWGVCGWYGHLAETDSPFWDTLRDSVSFIRVVRWRPRAASWVSIRRSVDSLRRSAP